MKKTIKFPKEADGFLLEIKKSVQDHLKKHGRSKYGGRALLYKYVIIKTVFIINYILIIQSSEVYVSLLHFAIMGPIFMLLAINVSHDGVHGVAHANKTINRYMCYQMDLIGVNSFAWKRRHKTGHHTYANVLGKDPDLKQSKIVRIFPNSTKLWLHQFQHIYVPFLYAFYSINWIFIRDLTDFVSSKSPIGKIPLWEYIKLICFKSMYIAIFFVIPTWWSELSFLQVLLGNVLMHVVASYCLTVALVPSHVSADAVFPVPNDEGMMPYSWSHHQVMTTIDFATDSKVVTWLLGGFNHHIVHHLFPSISHIHYAQITPIVKRAIRAYGLPYKHEDSLYSAYKSHYLLLKNNGRKKK